MPQLVVILQWTDDRKEGGRRVSNITMRREKGSAAYLDFEEMTGTGALKTTAILERVSKWSKMEEKEGSKIDCLMDQ